MTIGWAERCEGTVPGMLCAPKGIEKPVDGRKGPKGNEKCDSRIGLCPGIVSKHNLNIKSVEVDERSHQDRLEGKETAAYSLRDRRASVGSVRMDVGSEMAFQSLARSNQWAERILAECRVTAALSFLLLFRQDWLMQDHLVWSDWIECVAVETFETIDGPVFSPLCPTNR